MSSTLGNSRGARAASSTGVERGTHFLVTRRGAPVAAIVPLDEEALEDFVLAHGPRYIRDRELADRELAIRRTTSPRSFLEQEGESGRERKSADGA